MKARSKELLDRATAAMVAAIDVYNKPDFLYRGESFAILALNGWELLLKARWLAKHNNKLSSLYVREGKGTRRQRIKKTSAGNPFTHSVDYLAKKLWEQKILDEKAFKNLQLLTELRDSVVHFYSRSPKFTEMLHEIGAAALKNFVAAVRDWFDRDLSEFNFYLMPLSFISLPVQHVDGIVLNREEKRFVDYLRNVTPEDDDVATPYSVTVNVEVRFIRSKARDAFPIQVTNDPNVPAVRLTEEQIRERYPWYYKQLTEKCKERYADFKVDKKYHDLRKSLESDKRFAHIRRLDPDNPKSPKKPFFNPNIVNEFDKHYEGK
jgi:hypothetical protein